MKLITTLTQAGERFSVVEVPSFVLEQREKNPVSAEMDARFNPRVVLGEVDAIQKAFLCLLGAYNCGKTFLIRYLMEKGLLLSGINPTTSAITVLRHLHDKPKDWEAAATVFGLKPGVDPRSLMARDVLVSGGYDLLKPLTTYQEGQDQLDVVIVFVDDPFLEDKCVLDVPGTGGLNEADFAEAADAEEETWSAQEDVKQKEVSRSRKQQKLQDIRCAMRERTLQTIAMGASDGFLLLSSMQGTGCFSDSNIAFLIYKLADHVGRFPTRVRHENVLIIGSRANPAEGGLDNTRELMSHIRSALLKQIDRLPKAQKEQIDLEAMLQRIVLFYALDATQREVEVQKYFRILRRDGGALSDDDALKKAGEQVDEDAASSERVEDFKASLTTMVSNLNLQLDTCRFQLAEQRLAAGQGHFLQRGENYSARAGESKTIEVLSKRYAEEQTARDMAWATLSGRAEHGLAEARAKTIRDFEQKLSRWTDARFVEDFIRETYTDKQQAKDYAPDEIQARLNDALNKAAGGNMGMRVVTLESDLKKFDKDFLQRREGEISSIKVSQTAGEIGLSKLDSFSSLETFTAITAGLAGGTTLLAALGSVTATAIFVKAAALTVGFASMFGAGGAVAGVILGIPLAGWIVGAAALIGWVLKWFFTDWQTSMAKTLAKSAKSKSPEIMAAAREAINKLFANAERVVDSCLSETKKLVDGHIQQIHGQASGAINSSDLESAGTYYKQVGTLLGDTLKQIQAEASVNP